MSRARNLTRPEGGPPRRRRGLTPLTPLIAFVLAGTAGCTATEPSDARPDAASTAATPAEPEPLATETTIGLVEGKLSDKSVTRLKAKVGSVVDAWIDAAYAGDYPRTDFSEAYPGFSPGAAKQASRDSLMSNAAIGDRIDTVELTKRRVRVDILAVKRRAVGITARFVLAQDVAGEIKRSERIAGNLYLTYQRGDWEVFAYDAKRGTR